jgi:hypothetical protein
MMWKPQQAGRYSSGLKKMLFLRPFLVAWLSLAAPGAGFQSGCPVSTMVTKLSYVCNWFVSSRTAT